MHPVFTKEKFEELRKELAQLALERKAAVIDLKKARDMGDLSENGYYKAARFKLSGIDRRLRELKYFTTKGKVIEKSSLDGVQLGSVVVLEYNGKKISYTIVGSYEANPKDRKISDASPLGKALLNKKPGDVIQFLGKTFLIKRIM